MSKEKIKCPECGSSRVSADGDYVEELEGPDRMPRPTHYYGWWMCEECMHQWRYQDEALNPGDPNAEPQERAK